MDIFSPIQKFADVFSYQWLGLVQHSYWAETVNFFVYDLIKIGLLLVVINYIMAITRHYFPMEKVRDILTKKRLFGMGYLIAAFLGVVTPFCSCSSIPLFIGFLSAGIPLGITFAFLISSPLVNEASLYLFPAVFGLKVTLFYNLVGIGIAVIGGYLIGRLKMEKYIRPEFLKFKSKSEFLESYNGKKIPLKNLCKHWSGEAMDITKKIFPFVLIGVGLGAMIHGFVPESLVSQYLSTKSWWAVPFAVLLGAPLYANSVGVVPIIEALVGKGVSLGSALSFMTATVTISIPEGLMLMKIMKKQLLFAFFGITIVGIIFMGYLFNFVL